jgi:uncharacterized spore protein YtfJ
MKMHLEELVPQITDFLKNEANTETVIGKQFQLGEFICVPVIRVGMGFGSGIGEGDAPKQGHGEGGGVAGGMGVEPIGFLVASKERISFVSTKASMGLSKAFEKVPSLIEKYLETQNKEDAVAAN